MPSTATYDDANLILRLYEMRREERMRTARKWYAHSFGPESLDEFRRVCAYGSESNTYFRQVSTYYEMLASFITTGVLNEELYFQSGGELFLVYTRLEPILQPMREAFKNPALYKNLETVAKRYSDYINRADSEATEAARTRIKSMLIAKP